jgi:hypothetical protein
VTARRLLVAGLVLAAVALLLIAVAPADALRGWLAAAFLWSGVPIGALGFIMIIHLTGGRWGHATLPTLEAAALTLPIAAAALLPVLAGMSVLYPWVSAAPEGFKGGWLAPTPFVLRTIVLFAGLGLALWALVRRRGSAVAVSCAGLIFLVPMMSLVAVDWLLSLDLEFHSSGFGLYALSIQFTVGWMAATWLLLRRQPEQTAALAALFSTLILTWLYLAFTSYFIIWSGDLSDVVGWYMVRGQGGWGIAYALAATIEAAAFVILLFSRPRNSARWLSGIAVAMIAGKVIETAWLVLPQGGPLRLGAVALYLLAVVALGLVFGSAHCVLLDRRVAARRPA